jgi:hypothetical protein
MTRWLAIIFIAVAGCTQVDSTETRLTPAQEATLRILKRHQELVHCRAEAEKVLEKPSAVAAVWTRYGDELERLDLSACPADFRVAFRRHARACRDIEAAIREFPDGSADSVVIGFLNGLGGEADGGFSRLQRDLQAAWKQGAATYDEVERTALSHGVAL